MARYECEIIAQIHHFVSCGLSVATIYGRGETAESQGKVREKSGNLFFHIQWEPVAYSVTIIIHVSVV